MRYFRSLDRTPQIKKHCYRAKVTTNKPAGMTIVKKVRKIIFVAHELSVTEAHAVNRLLTLGKN